MCLYIQVCAFPRAGLFPQILVIIRISVWRIVVSGFGRTVVIRRGQNIRSSTHIQTFHITRFHAMLPTATTTATTTHALTTIPTTIGHILQRIGAHSSITDGCLLDVVAIIVFVQHSLPTGIT